MRAFVAFSLLSMSIFSAGCSASSDDQSDGEATGALRAPDGIVLRYGDELKGLMIEYELFKAEDFTGTDVVIQKTDTKLDIIELTPDHDIEPHSYCYRGPAANAKEILGAMVYNAGQTGDRFVVENSTSIELDSSNVIQVHFKVVGEGGQRSYDLSVPLCVDKPAS